MLDVKNVEWVSWDIDFTFSFFSAPSNQRPELHSTSSHLTQSNKSSHSAAVDLFLMI